MSELDLFQLVILPVGLGLLGFVEPCSIGSSLVFIKYVEGQSAAIRIAQAGVFALTRALFIGVLGALVALIGTIFLSLQKGAWLLLGLLYIAIGAFYAFGKAGLLMRSFGPSLSRVVGPRASVGLGLLFGLNIPACAAPLIFALLALRPSAAGAMERWGWASSASACSVSLFRHRWCWPCSGGPDVACLTGSLACRSGSRW